MAAMSQAQQATAPTDPAYYANYQQWEVVTTPSGGTYYKVPGTSFVYDPFTSGIKGKPVLFRNPQPELDKEAAAQSEHDKEVALRDKQVAAQLQAASPAGQVLPIAGTVAGTVGAGWAMNQFGKDGIESLINTPNGPVAVTKGGTFVGPGAQSVSAPASTAANVPTSVISPNTPVSSSFMGVTPPVPAAAGAIPDAPVILGDGSFSAVNMPANPAALEAQLAASQGGALSGFAPVGSEFAGMGTLSQVALPVGAALGAYQLGGSLLNERKAGTLGGASSGAAMGAMAGSVIPGVGTLIGAGVGALAGGILGQFGHGHNFYEGEARKKQIKTLAGGGDTISLPTADGGSFTVSAHDFAKDPNFFIVREGVTPDEIARANMLVGIDANNTDKVGILAHQTAALLANAIHSGVDPATIQQRLGGGAAPAPTAPASLPTPPPIIPGAKVASNAGAFTNMRPMQGIAVKPILALAGSNSHGSAPQQMGTPSAARPTLGAVEVINKKPTVANVRSATRSPGIALDGHKLSAAELGKQLAHRINTRH